MISKNAHIKKKKPCKKLDNTKLDHLSSETKIKTIIVNNARNYRVMTSNYD